MTRGFSISITPIAPRCALLALLAGVSIVLGGCAGFNTNPRDPLEPLNRKVSQFNEDVDRLVLKPVATVYRDGVPPLVRTGVSNFFGNLGDAWSFVNSALQFKFQNAAENFMRLNVNTFFGLGGILDIASDLNIERHKEDFGQTLGRWGVPPGPYVVLPLLGPSTVRDTVALPIDRKGDPVYYVDPAAERNSLYVLRAVDTRSNLLRLGTLVEGAALDKYSFTRDAYLQKRQADIGEGKDSDGSLPPVDEPAPEPAGEPAGGAPAGPGAPAPAPSR